MGLKWLGIKKEKPIVLNKEQVKARLNRVENLNDTINDILKDDTFKMSYQEFLDKYFAPVKKDK